MLKYFKTNKELRAKLATALAEKDAFRQSCFSLLESTTAERVIEQILGRKLRWFDYSRLPKDEQTAYFKEAQYILESKVFNNEISAYTLDLIEEIAKRSKDFDNVLTLRAKIVMGELFRERLMQITKPKEDKKEAEDPHSTI